MVQIRIIAAGKNKDAWVDESIRQYLTFLKKYAAVSMVYIPEIKGARNLNEAKLRQSEAAAINRRLSRNPLISLSDKGKLYNSLEFAEFIQQFSSRHSAIDFAIGGAYGLDKSILEASSLILSLSPLTMSHQLIRPVLLEQLFRAFSIIKGGSYHK